MTIARDLSIIALDEAAPRPWGQGDLSLALAGAELIDLLGAEAVRLEDDRVVPGLPPTFTDPLLEQAAGALSRRSPYEPVGDWLWRRGRDLAEAYVDTLEAEGLLTRRRRFASSRKGRPVLADSPDRRRAADRRTAREPVLTALAAAAGVDATGTGEAPSLPDDTDDAVAAVVAAVYDAVTELEAERQRRSVEKAAFDNIWRGHAD